MQNDKFFADQNFHPQFYFWKSAQIAMKGKSQRLGEISFYSQLSSKRYIFSLQWCWKSIQRLLYRTETIKVDKSQSKYKDYFVFLEKKQSSQGCHLFQIVGSFLLFKNPLFFWQFPICWSILPDGGRGKPLKLNRERLVDFMGRFPK